MTVNAAGLGAGPRNTEVCGILMFSFVALADIPESMYYSSWYLTVTYCVFYNLLICMSSKHRRVYVNVDKPAPLPDRFD